VHERWSMDEPSIQPLGPAPVEEHANHLLERVAGALTSIVAVLLLAFVAVALAGAVTAAWSPIVHDHNFTEGALKGLDASFLAIILLELVHTTLARGPISSQIQQFLVVGVTAGVRAGLEVAASEADPRDIVVNLLLNAVGVFVLVGALLLVRRRVHAEKHGSTD